MDDIDQGTDPVYLEFGAMWSNDGDSGCRAGEKDGSHLDVNDHFKGRIRAKTCGPKARKVKTAEAIELREIVCAAVEQRLFNVVLTPNHNRAHRNHFHLEVMPGVEWMLVR